MKTAELYYLDYLYHDSDTGNWYGSFGQLLPGWEAHGVYYANLRTGINRLVEVG